MVKKIEFQTLLGKTFKSVVLNDDHTEITFTANDGKVYKLEHDQECCENVFVESIVGDLNDLIGESILRAEE